MTATVIDLAAARARRAEEAAAREAAKAAAIAKAQPQARACSLAPLEPVGQPAAFVEKPADVESEPIKMASECSWQPLDPHRPGAHRGLREPANLGRMVCPGGIRRSRWPVPKAHLALRGRHQAMGRGERSYGDPLSPWPRPRRSANRSPHCTTLQLISSSPKAGIAVSSRVRTLRDILSKYG